MQKDTFHLHISIQFYSKCVTLKLNNLLSVLWQGWGSLRSWKAALQQ